MRFHTHTCESCGPLALPEQLTNVFPAQGAGSLPRCISGRDLRSEPVCADGSGCRDELGREASPAGLPSRQHAESVAASQAGQHALAPHAGQGLPNSDPVRHNAQAHRRAARAASELSCDSSCMRAGTRIPRCRIARSSAACAGQHQPHRCTPREGRERAESRPSRGRRPRRCMGVGPRRRFTGARTRPRIGRPPAVEGHGGGLPARPGSAGCRRGAVPFPRRQRGSIA